MTYDLKHFPNIEDFLGIDWLEAGCAKLDRQIGRMVASGRMDSTVEANDHAIHQLWYNHILGKPLPSDIVIKGDYKIEHGLRQGHRLLTVEQLLAKLRPTWDAGIADSVRDKLRNPPQFESTLYELLVVVNFREAGHDVNIRLPEGKATADIAGTILEAPAHIECKRVTFRAKPHTTRLAELGSLADEILNVVSKWNQSTVVSIEFEGPAGTAEMDRVRSLFSGVHALPDWRRHVYIPGPWSVRISSAGEGQPQMTGDFDQYDVLTTDGLIDASTGTSEKLHAVGIKDHTPSDWGAVVRKSLNTARRQLERGRCNIICIEVADMAYFTDVVEIERVFEATERFLAYDSRRVSGVILTSIGVIKDGPNRAVKSGPVRFRTAGQSWLLRNPNPFVELPPDFAAPRFDKPEVLIQASMSANKPTPSTTE